MAISQHFVRRLYLNNQIIRSFMMSARLRADQVVEEMKTKNPYYDKYAEKIAKFQKTSPEEFLNRVENFAEKQKPKETKRTYSELLNPKPCASEIDPTKSHKSLNDIMKTELLKDKSVEDITHLWYEYHRDKNAVAAVLTTEQYDKLIKRGEKNPIFILPLPRSEGYEFIMLQFASNCVHFTPLIAYQVHKENAPECLNLIHYTELRDKGIILMRGEFDNQVLNGQEAQCLANQLQMYYYMDDKFKSQLLDKFTNQPDSFKHGELIKQLEQIELK